MSRYLHGFHDPGGEHLFGDRPGWITHTVALSSDGPTDYRVWADKGIGNIVRLNWGYGSTGTIPLSSAYPNFAKLCKLYVQASPGCKRWIIGNEPNHAQEWPDGRRITPQEYVKCFEMCRNEIKSVQPEAEVLVAGMAPWNDRDAGPWLDYFEEVIDPLGRNLDGFAIHAYTHGPESALIYSDQKMNPPYQHLHWHFRVYRDWLQVIPRTLWHLPVYGTEANQGDNGWLNVHNAYVQELYAEIDRWNKNHQGPKIYCFCLYRWPAYDKWAIVDKEGVQRDFKAAVELGFPSPEASTQTTTPAAPGGAHGFLLSGAGESGTSVAEGGPLTISLTRQWDARLTQRGVHIVSPLLAPGQTYWKATEVKWYDEQEADRLGPDHHIMLDVQDEAGNRLVNVPLLVTWPGGQKTVLTEAKPGEPFSANFPMSPSRNEFSVKVNDGTPSEEVKGIGMGMDTPGGFNAGIHTSTSVRFRRVKSKEDKPLPSPPSPPPLPPGPTAPGKLELVHPVADSRYRTITQGWGENPDFYSRFKVDGVALKGHNGLDFGTPVGSMIVAVADGVAIEVAEDDEGFGKYIKLRHSWGESLYAHLSKTFLAHGEHVSAGEQIGLSGNTGKYNTGPHLHFAMRVAPYNRKDGWGGFTDPSKYAFAGTSPLPPPPVPTEPSIPQPAQVAEIIKAIKVAAYEFGIDWTLIANVAWAESSFRVNVTSSSGAMGLMGLMPATWEEWKVKVPGATDPFKALDNIRVGTAYLNWLLDYFQGSRYKALVAYNWGIGNVIGGHTPPSITVTYAGKIIHGDDLLQTLEDGGMKL